MQKNFLRTLIRVFLVGAAIEACDLVNTAARSLEDKWEREVKFVTSYNWPNTKQHAAEDYEELLVDRWSRNSWQCRYCRGYFSPSGINNLCPKKSQEIAASAHYEAAKTFIWLNNLSQLCNPKQLILLEKLPTETYAVINLLRTITRDIDRERRIREQREESKLREVRLQVAPVIVLPPQQQSELANSNLLQVINELKAKEVNMNRELEELRQFKRAAQEEKKKQEKEDEDDLVG